MSVSTRKAVLFAVAFLLSAPLLFAANPSARTQSRMVYDARTRHIVLFGGLTAYDSGTKLAYDLDDTWELADGRWVQIFPSTVPPSRSIHVMVYDSLRARTVMFGGKHGTGYLNDTWAYTMGQWTDLQPATQPPVRSFAGAAYDNDRDRIVMYGGSVASTDVTVPTVNLFDTWEFDGTDWKQVGSNGPQIIKPLLTYDKTRHQMLMLGEETSTLKPHMYTFDAANATWNEVTGATLPTCVNDSILQYQESTQTVVLSSGLCSALESGTFEWDGTTWNKLTPTAAAPFAAGSASAYDAANQQIVIFGGTFASGEILPIVYAFSSNTWTALTDSTTPGPRSLMAFRADPDNKIIWMFGGIDEASTLADLWKYVNGSWLRVTYESNDQAPGSCLTPASAFDTDRQKLVVICADSSVYEWDGAAWKKFTSLKPAPQSRRFSSAVYDKNIKKTVLFGGYNETDYLNETWTWNGSVWTRVGKDKPPTARSNTMMWFDANLNKTVFYGGVGRITTLDATTRYSDMWSFDGTKWTDMKITNTPGARYGAQIAVDPRDNHLFLFGGLGVKTDGTIQTQIYKDDTWEWDGAAWTQLTTDGAPFARENGAFEFDPGRNNLVLFGGYAGHYLSDLWVFDGDKWIPRSQGPAQRRRAGR